MEGVHALADEALREPGELARQERIGLESFRIHADVAGQVKRLYYTVRKIAQILVAGSGERSG